MNPHRSALLRAWSDLTPRVPLKRTPRGALSRSDRERVRRHLRAEVRTARVELRRIEERAAGVAWAREEEARAEAALLDTLSRSVRVREGEGRSDYRGRLADLAEQLRGRRALARAGATEEEPSDERPTLPLPRAPARASDRTAVPSAVHPTRGARPSDTRRRLKGHLRRVREERARQRAHVPAGPTVEGPLGRLLLGGR